MLGCFIIIEVSGARFDIIKLTILVPRRGGEVEITFISRIRVKRIREAAKKSAFFSAPAPKRGGG